MAVVCHWKLTDCLLNTNPYGNHIMIDNPYWAAQTFIERNDLSQDFLEQIANFIIQNAKGVTIGSGDSMARSDPFTG